MEKSLHEIVESLYLKAPDEKMLWWKGHWWSRKDFFDLTIEMEKRLVDSGFKEGYRIATLLPNCPSLLALSVSCWRLGGAVVPLNLTAGPGSLIKYFDHCDPFAIVIADIPMKHSFQFDTAKMKIPVIKTSLEGNIPSFSGGVCQREDPATAVLFYTSGTTGFPKAVPLTHENLRSNVFAAVSHFKDLDTETDIIMNALPNFHALGYSSSGLLAMLSGIKQLVLPTFMPPETALEAMNASGVTFVIAVPTMIALLVSAAARGSEVPPHLKKLVSGGDRFPVALDARVQRLLGVSVCEGYGLTECSPVVAVNQSPSARKVGTVGPMLPGFEYEVRGEGGEVLAPGMEGILWLKGPSITSGYFRDPENTAAKFKDGWFDTGDIVKIDDEGYVTILDRASDLIIVGGFNVYPQEVEAILNSHPKVKESAAVGMAHSVSGQIVKAFVIRADNEVTTRELQNFCKDKLAHYKTPRVIEFVDDFPRNSLGKVLRRKLREW